MTIVTNMQMSGREKTAENYEHSGAEIFQIENALMRIERKTLKAHLARDFNNQ